VFSAGAPTFQLASLSSPVVLGREGPFRLEGDERVSRLHAEVSVQANSSTSVRDLGSRNGTYVDGVRCAPEIVSTPRVVRVGRSLFVVTPDASAWRGTAVSVKDGLVVGPVSRRWFLDVERAARTSRTLLVTGETGVGKEHAARAFHAQGPFARGPFVAVASATLTEDRLRALESTRGRELEGGVLFLDEVADLPPVVQAGLLRWVDGTAGKSFAVCASTHRSLVREVAEGRFREDLYHRLARPVVSLSPLRERILEIPAYVSLALGGASAHVSLVEAAMLRPWPGNARELLSAVRAAAALATDESSSSVRDSHLDPSAGQALAEERSGFGEAEVRAALEAHGWNVSGTAKALGLHRTQLYRLVERWGLVRPADGK
jgi:transcriptional regulator of acetoin/glycerol metabolism